MTKTTFVINADEHVFEKISQTEASGVCGVRTVHYNIALHIFACACVLCKVCARPSEGKANYKNSLGTSCKCDQDCQTKWKY